MSRHLKQSRVQVVVYLVTSTIGLVTGGRFDKEKAKELSRIVSRITGGNSKRIIKKMDKN